MASLTHITLVIKQPDDPRAGQLLLEQVTYVTKLYGGTVIARAPGDEVALCQRLKERLPEEVERARQELAHSSSRAKGGSRPHEADQEATLRASR
jgi:hypothetical protein